MNGPDTSGEYIVGGAPQYIRDLFRNGTRDLKRWKKTATIEQLEDAYDFIRRDMPHLLEEVEKELNLRRHKELAEHLNQLKKPHWTLVPTFWLVIIGCAAGIVAAVMEVLNREEPVSIPSIDESKFPQKPASQNPEPQQAPAQK